MITDKLIGVQSVLISKREFVEKNSHSMNFSAINVMRHIPSLAITKSLDTSKYADKRVSIKSDVVENFELKNKMKSELATNTPGICILHTYLHARGAIIRKGNKVKVHWRIFKGAGSCRQCGQLDSIVQKF